jgi:hypothetical protein
MDWQNSGQAGLSHIVLRSGPVERLLAGGFAFWGQGEDYVHQRSRGMGVHGHVFCVCRASATFESLMATVLKCLTSHDSCIWTSWSWLPARSKSTCSIPKNKHAIKIFFGLCTYYTRFISSFTNTAKLVTKLTEQQAFKWIPMLFPDDYVEKCVLTVVIPGCDRRKAVVA